MQTMKSTIMKTLGSPAMIAGFLLLYSNWIQAQTGTQAEKLMEALEAKNLNSALVIVQNIDAVDYSDKKGFSLLMKASMNGYIEICRTLIEKGAKVDLQIPAIGLTALGLASARRHAEVVKLLLEKGANPDIQAAGGLTALMGASYNGFAEVVKLLLKKVVNVDLRTNKEETALFMASQQGHTEVVKLLLEKGANVDLQTKDGATALMGASQQGNTEVVKLLLEKGANPDLQILSKTDYSREIGYTRAIQTLGGQTALFYASVNGHIEIAKLLLDKGANPNLRDATGKTPLDYAKNADIRTLITAYIKNQ